GEPVDGLRRTSLDLALQTRLEAEVHHTVQIMRDRGVEQAAVVVLDNRTGEILAWVGSPDFWADSAGQVDMVVSPRQPGSALKPFLYALTFDRGYTPASIIADIPHTYETPTGLYRPRNYDRAFHGPVRAREALASSYNVPAIELTDRVGVSSLLRTLQLAGFASLDRTADYYGLGLALGNGDVTLLELALLHRAIMLTAERYAPGGLPSPASVGAVPVTICRLSGLRATAECPGMVERFVPGTEPVRSCDWHRGGSAHLPTEYAEWAAQAGP